MKPEKILFEFCNCGGKGHVTGCQLGKRLKIKYLPAMQKIWPQIGGEACENLINEIMLATKEHPWN